MYSFLYLSNALSMQGREVIFDLISWRIHNFYQTHVSKAVKCRPVREIKDDVQVNDLKLRKLKFVIIFISIIHYNI